MTLPEKSAATINPGHHGLKQYEVKTSTVVFMIFCLCAAGAYGNVLKIRPALCFSEANADQFLTTLQEVLRQG